MNKFFRQLLTICLTILLSFGLASGSAYATDQYGGALFKKFTIGPGPNMGILSCIAVPNTKGLKLVELWVDTTPRGPGSVVRAVHAPVRVQGSGAAQNIDLSGVPSQSNLSYLRVALFSVAPNANSSVNMSGGYSLTAKESALNFNPSTVFVECPRSTDGSFDPLKVLIRPPNEAGLPKPANTSTPEPGWSLNLDFPVIPIPEWVGEAVRNFVRDR